ncbi:MAG: beta-propeller domain-containing protein [Acidobacteria bacterium]|nr:beta-propeller domain-containing protein [Acidobacteriota bacterium]
MKKSFAIGLVVLVTGVFAFSLSTFFPFGLETNPDIAAGSELASKPQKTMRPFGSEEALKAHFKKIADKQERDRREMTKSAGNTTNQPSPSSVATDSMAAAESKAGPDKDDGITNNQHAGVDEGGIVKVHGENLVILRRGRLFTVKVGSNSLAPISSVNAYAPGVNPNNDWYDEMLVSNNTIVVIGYSYGRGGTEINLFDISERGSLAFRSSYHLKSNDYYSSRNYASRLIGNKLVFYTPQYIGYHGDPTKQFPALRRWHKGATEGEFKTVVSATRVYRTAKSEDSASSSSALHTVTVCDLAAKDMTCEGTGVLGAPGRVFYVSPKSVYVWTSEWNYRNGSNRSASMVYNMPLDGSAPSALGVAGAPVDQFSFLESDDEHLNVLVRSEGNGEQMWGSERTAGDVALFRTSLDAFNDGSESASRESYRNLPNVEGYTMQNRFVGDHILYGAGNGWGRQKNADGANLYAVNWKRGGTSSLYLDHSVDRIEQMGSDAVVVGTNGQDLYFSPIELSRMPQVKQSYIRKNASQGELRSHGFFYKPDGKDSGLLGLPIAREGRPGYKHLMENSAAVLFIRNSDMNLSQIGELEAKNTSTADNCKAACVDWYGNARPIFLRGRVFALLGYEIVEGRLDDARMREVRRVNYSPGRRMSEMTEE